MKKIIFSLLILSTALGAYSQATEQQNEQQNSKELRQVAKQERKIKAEEEQTRLGKITNLMLTYKRFVLEADYVGNQTGNRIPVTSNLNFIIVDSNKVTLQLGSFQGVGINGVGGVTVDGNITNYQLHKIDGRRGNVSYYVSMTIISSVGNYDISMNVGDTGRADARVSGTVSGQLNYYGNLVPLSLSRVYKGTPYP
jgi:hypothetical protein